jgi:rubrerythrin
MMKRMSRMSGAAGMFSSTSSMFNSSSNSNNPSSLKYYCISCGAEHKEAACPQCGSKMKKVGF